MKVEVVRDLAALDDLRAEWDDLFAHTAVRHPFLTHEWLTTWWRHFGQAGGLFVVCVRDAGRLLGISTLQREVMRVRGLPLLRQLDFATGGAADYRDFIIRAGREWEFFETLFGWLRDEAHNWRVLTLRGVHAGSVTNELLPILAREVGLYHAGATAAACPYIPLPTTCEEFVGTMSRATRQKYAQKWRKLAREHGEPELRVLAGPEVGVAEVESFIALHQLSWEARGGSKALTSDALRDFHRELVLALAPKHLPFLAFLTLGKKDIACIYGFVSDGVFYDYLPGFDPAYAGFSIGAQAIFRLVEYGISAGWREFDLMRGAERYKFHFTRRCRHNIDHIVTRTPRLLKVVAALESLSTPGSP